MAKRNSFYVPAAIFAGGHSAYAVAVYAYLCFCADRSGVCFPAMETIAAHCGVARSTVKKALTELERSGLVRSEAIRLPCPSGKMRCSTNRFCLAAAQASETETPPENGVPSAVPQRTPPPCDGPSPRREKPAPPPCGSGEINDNSKVIKGDVPSVGTIAREDTTGPDAILEPLHLDSFYDRAFAESVRQAIVAMYGMPSLSVNGRRIGCTAIRDRLRMLTIDHIDFIEQQLENRAGEVTHGERYLMACLYNAPVDCMVKNAADRFG